MTTNAALKNEATTVQTIFAVLLVLCLAACAPGTAAPNSNPSNEGIVCGDPTAIPNDLAGYGIVDAYAAVERALAEK